MPKGRPRPNGKIGWRPRLSYAIRLKTLHNYPRKECLVNSKDSIRECRNTLRMIISDYQTFIQSPHPTVTEINDNLKKIKINAKNWQKSISNKRMNGNTWIERLDDSYRETDLSTASFLNHCMMRKGVLQGTLEVRKALQLYPLPYENKIYLRELLGLLVECCDELLQRNFNTSIHNHFEADAIRSLAKFWESFTGYSAQSRYENSKLPFINVPAHIDEENYTEYDKWLNKEINPFAEWVNILFKKANLPETSVGHVRHILEKTQISENSQPKR